MLESLSSSNMYSYLSAPSSSNALHLLLVPRVYMHILYIYGQPPPRNGKNGGVLYESRHTKWAGQCVDYCCIISFACRALWTFAGLTLLAFFKLFVRLSSTYFHGPKLKGGWDLLLRGVHTYVHVCTYIHTYVYIHNYIHTYVHMPHYIYYMCLEQRRRCVTDIHIIIHLILIYVCTYWYTDIHTCMRRCVTGRMHTRP